MKFCYLKTPIGQLLLAGDDDRLCLIGFPDGRMRHKPEPGWTRDDAAFGEARRQLTEYFAGERKTFELALNPRGTDFQLAVLEELRRIPYGQTVSYRDIAERIGNPKAVRAVGAANGRNPLPIVIPCHRVIGSDGHLTGFGGGLDTKTVLLELERRHAA